MYVCILKGYTMTYKKFWLSIKLCLEFPTPKLRKRRVLEAENLTNQCKILFIITLQVLETLM